MAWVTILTADNVVFDTPITYLVPVVDAVIFVVCVSHPLPPLTLANIFAFGAEVNKLEGHESAVIVP